MYNLIRSASPVPLCTVEQTLVQLSWCNSSSSGIYSMLLSLNEQMDISEVQLTWCCTVMIMRSLISLSIILNIAVSEVVLGLVVRK